MAADQDGLSYAWTFPEEYTAAVGRIDRRGPMPQGESHDIGSSWGPGFRLSTGYRFPKQAWELSLDWTYQHCHAESSTSIQALTAETLIATWFPAAFNAGGFFALHAHANWVLVFNTLDLCLARSSFATKSVEIDPFIAFTGAFIHQSFTTSYEQGRFLNQTVLDAEDVTFSMHNNFDGWGLKPGLRSSWFLTKRWSLYANGAFSFLFGRFATKQHATMPDRSLIDAHDQFFQNAFAIELTAGTKWGMFFDKQKKYLRFSLGYEMMSWFNQNQLFNYFFVDQAPGAGQPSQGDLGLQGINLSVEIDY